MAVWGNWSGTSAVKAMRKAKPLPPAPTGPGTARPVTPSGNGLIDALRANHIPVANPPTMPNPGTYDPTYDINIANAQRGYDRTYRDFTTNYGELGAGAQGGRAATDLQTALSRIGTNENRTVADYWTQAHAIDRADTRNAQDYGIATRNLGLQYTRLGDTQRQSAYAAGINRGGALQQAAAKRAANQGRDQSALDLARQRAHEDYARQSEGLSTATNRTLQDLLSSKGDANLTYSRGREDALTGLSDTTFDNGQYARDMGRLAYYSSGQVQPDTIAQALGNIKVTGKGTYRKTASGKWLRIS